MDRRTFIQKSAFAGSTLPWVGPLSPSDLKSLDDHESRVPDTEVIDALENEFLKVEIQQNAVLKITDKVNKMEWRTYPVTLQEFGPIDEGHVWLRQERSMMEQFPGRFTIRKTGDTFEYILTGRERKPMGRFSVQINLQGGDMVIKTFNISSELRSLVFPVTFMSDAIVIPKGIGKIIRKQEPGGIYGRQIHTFFSHLNMRWIGGTKGNHAWIGIYEDGFEDAACLVANRTVSPAFMQTLGKWIHPFVLRFKFIHGNYMELAKTYRAWFIEKKYFKSLREKAEQYPQLKNLAGGKVAWINLAMASTRKKDAEDYLLSDAQINQRGDDAEVNIYHTYNQVADLLLQYKENGLKNGLIKIAGWINKGYDGSHPDVWPPEPRLGSLDDFKKLMNVKDNLIMGLHDNYLDMYEGVPSWPKGLNITRDGQYLIGGFWAGGQAYILNSNSGLKYAKRNWTHIKALNPQAMFIDTTTATQLYQSYEKENTLNKATDLKLRIEQIKFFKEQGVLYGSEEVADFAIPYIDWYENRHTRVADEYVPLWPLVFHDAAFVVRYNGNGMNNRYGYPGMLEDMLWGYMSFFSNKSEPVADKKFFSDTAPLDQWHQQIAMDEMISHKFLTDDFTVERTDFSSGKSIIVNFGKHVVSIDDATLQPFSYRIIS
jgi:hypothetical protein